jgi:formylglycine-generating enzyme required for sulfatase activity
VAQMLPRMIEVPSGVFRLGSSANELGRVDNECPPKVVSIQRPFEIGACAVTGDQFVTFADATDYPTTVRAKPGVTVHGLTGPDRFAVRASSSRGLIQPRAGVGRMHAASPDGCLAKRVRHIVCQRRRNGSTARAPERRPAIGGATISILLALTADP